MRTLVDLIEGSARRHPSRPALLVDESQCTFDELNARINQVAHALSRRGLGRGDRVALFLPNRAEYVEAFFACAKIGATAVPVNLALRAPELRRVVRRAAPAAILGVKQSAGAIAAAGDGTPALLLDASGEAEGCAGSGRDVERECVENPRIPVEPAEIASCLFTSGTTGEPKGILLTHGNLIANTRSLLALREWDGPQVFGNALPMFHGYPTTILMLYPFAMGSALALMPRFAPEAALATIERRRVTFFGGVPAMYALFNRVKDAGRFDVSSVRVWLCGGAPLPAAVREEFERRYGAPIHEGYGLIETSPVLTMNPLDASRRPGSIGRPVAGVTLEIVDEAGSPVPPGQVGEIVASGPNVMQGYFDDPRATAEVLQGGRFRTGDLGFVDGDGYYHLAGRRKELIIVGGENVHPAEVENVLLEHPEIVDAAAVGFPDGLRGEAVRAFVVSRNGSPPSEAELLAHCRRALAAFKVPRRIDVVEELPRGATGKILRSQLRSR